MKHNIKYILSVCIGIALTMGLSAQTNAQLFLFHGKDDETQPA